MDIDGPNYELELITQIAQSGNVHMEKNAAKSSRNHGYYEPEVAACLSSLKAENYHKSVSYPNSEGSRKDLVFDIYKITCPNSDNEKIYLYIKLRVSKSNYLFVGSYKPDGAI